MVWRSGRDREIRRLVKAVTGAGGGDQTDLRAVDQHLDLLALGLDVRARWAAWNEMLYEPATRSTDWLMLPVPLMKATWVPSGALGLPEVKPLPLLLTPAAAENCQARTGGRKLVLPRVQGRCLEAAVADGVGRREGHLVDEGRVVASQGVQTEELDGVRPGRHRKRRRLVGGIRGV